VKPVRTAAQFAQSVNYQIQYTPGPVEPDGSIRSYALRPARATTDSSAFYTDNTGAVHATREKRPPLLRIHRTESRPTHQTAVAQALLPARYFRRACDTAHNQTLKDARRKEWLCYRPHH